uniref:Uncharacterized protein n=1 Tax=Setaria viridis TaxID=4556 RepID=A0A4U6UR01_SETVI|nr:hypothetical protein SEVIR_5G096101v2 [Setaria viridis]
MATGKSLAPACVAAMPCNLPRRAMPSSLPKASISPSNASIVRYCIQFSGNVAVC